MTVLTVDLLKDWFKNSGIYSQPNVRELAQIKKLVEADKYCEIHKDYGNTYNLILLELFESLEEYETCEIIFKTIKGLNLPTKRKSKFKR